MYSFCCRVLVDEVFPRSDYLELCELTFFWLGGDIPNFHFRKPKKANSARFMQISVYYLTYHLISPQINFLSDVEIDEVKAVAEFIGLFYCSWFLESSLACCAPYNDLQAIFQMKKYNVFSSCAAICLKSWSRHLDYLSPQLVVLSLADKRVPLADKGAMAARLLFIPPPSTFPPQPQSCIIQNLTENHVSDVPCLSTFISEKSWLLFHRLGLMSQLDWLSLDPEVWKDDPNFCSFASFVRCMTVVNDPAERAVKLAKDFIDRSHNEETLQQNYVVVSEHRKMFPTTQTGKMKKSTMLTLNTF